MKSKAIPTVEEFIISKEVFDGILYSPLHKREFKLSELLHEYAVLFAKHHVRECKEAIKRNAQFSMEGYVDEESIENAYDEDNIK